MTDSAEVTDFFFQTLRKFRIFEGSSTNFMKNRLVTSSQLGVTIAFNGLNQTVCFPTASLASFKLSKENMGTEVKELKMKNVQLAGVQKINDAGVNCDGTLLAVLHTSNGNVSVDIFDIKAICSTDGLVQPFSKTSIGTDPSIEGSVVQWNPAFADTFAAASTDRSLLVVKIDKNNPSSRTIIGEKRFGAVTTAISWSPKGKQLTIGDSCGKVVQLKPELEVVRSIMPPDPQPQQPNYGKVTGLCWLATTEWVVSFAKDAQENDHDTYLMRCKKDKPTEWMLYGDISYSTLKCPLSAHLNVSTELLIHWNIVIAANSKNSDIVTIGKLDDWKTWTVGEGKGIYLPVAGRSNSFPVGLSIDRSVLEQVQIGFDTPAATHPPSPIVLCMTNDGVITAHHIVSKNPAHTSCQIFPEAVQFTGLEEQVFGAATPAPPTTTTTPKVASSSGLFSVGTPAASPTTTGLFGATTSTAPGMFGATTSTAPGLFGATTSPAPGLVRASAPLLTRPSLGIDTKAPVVTGTLVAPNTPKESAPKENVPKETAPKSPVKEDLNKKKEEEERMRKEKERKAKKEMVLKEMDALDGKVEKARDSIMKLVFGAQNAKKSVLECAEVVKGTVEDSKEVLDELQNLIKTIDWTVNRTKHTVKEMDFEIEDKMEYLSEIHPDDSEKALEALRDMSESERVMKFNKLEKSADAMNSKYAECQEIMKNLRISMVEKESLRKQAILSPLRTKNDLNRVGGGAENEIALKVMRNVTQIILDTREKLQKNELEFHLIQKNLKKKEGKKSSSSSRQQYEVMEETHLAGPSSRNQMSNVEIQKTREAILAKLKNRGVVKTKTVEIRSYKPKMEEVEAKDEIDTMNLSNAILKLSMTPRKVANASGLAGIGRSVGCDAATQADEPPVVKTVVVTVESPARPTVAAPVVTVPKSTVTTTTTPSVNVKVTEKVIDMPRKPALKPFDFSKPVVTPVVEPPTPSVIPPVNLFGTKKEDEKKVEEKKVEEKKVEAPPTPPLIEEVKALPTPPKEEVKKVEVVTPAVPVAPKVEEVKKEEVEVKKKEEEPLLPSRAPSFSFNTTPVAPKTTSSIFGGGAATPTTNIFGGTTTTTPKSTSSFGMFGQQQPQASVTTTPAVAAAAPAGNVSFSFNTAKPSGNTSGNAGGTTSAFGGFGQSIGQSKPSGFAAAAAAAAAQANADEGMEDDSGAGATTSSGSAPFGGGFMSGLGSSKPANSNTNLFAPKPATTTSNNSWIFGGGSNAGGQQQQQKSAPSFSFANAAAQAATTSPTSSSSAFGAAPKFGGQPVFGGKSSFGGGASGGALSKNSSIFGNVPAPSGGGFSQFATSNPSSLFGGAANSQQPQQTSSIFGGGNASNTSGNTSGSSIFGGGVSSSNTNKPASSFTSWR